MSTCGNESLDDSSTFSGFRSQCTIDRGLACRYCKALNIWQNTQCARLQIHLEWGSNLAIRAYFKWLDSTIGGLRDKVSSGSQRCSPSRDLWVKVPKNLKRFC